MNVSLDQEYLSRPLVEGVTYEIGPERISIHCSHTIYFRVVLPERYPKGRLLGTYRRILRTAKAKGIQVSYRHHFSRTIKERWPEYEAACEKQGALFRKLVEQAKNVQARGIHYGSADDMEYSRLQLLYVEYQPYTYRSSITSVMASICNSLEQLDLDLNQPTIQCDMIYL